MENVMFKVLENQFMEAIYLGNIYCHLQMAEVEGVKSFFTICVSPGNYAVSPIPTNLDFIQMYGLSQTLMAQYINDLKSKGYVYLNEEYEEKKETLDLLKDKFLLENPNIEGSQLKFAWHAYKIQNLDNYSIYIIDKFTLIKKYTEDTIDPDFPLDKLSYFYKDLYSKIF